MQKIALKFVLIVTCVLVAGCAKKDKNATTAPPDKTEDKQKPENLTLVQSTSASVATLHKQVASLDKISKVMDGPLGGDVKIDVKIEGIGGSKPSPKEGAKTKIAPGTGPAKGGKEIIGALLKSGSGLAIRGLGKTSARAVVPDTTFFSEPDTTEGTIYSIRTYGDDEVDRPYLARDSTVYQTPYLEEDPTVLFTGSQVTYADGGLYNTATFDDDGDGILNGSQQGQPIRLKKMQMTVDGDTTWRYWALSTHSSKSTNWFTMDDGMPNGYTDTTYIKGKVNAYSVTQDVDGDGSLNTTQDGVAKVKVESFTTNEDGTVDISTSFYGPGRDMDYDAWDDNVYYPYTNITLGPKGDTLWITKAEDVDGDGILNGFAKGKTVQIREISKSFSGDTSTKSISLTDYGTKTFWDSLGKGQVIYLADSTFEKGKVTWWSSTIDGDGDGFAYSAEAGKAVKVENDFWTRNEDGGSTISYNAYGIGLDKDYDAWEDNEQYPSKSITLGAKGDTLMVIAYNDADGDGLYFAKGAANKVSETSFYANQEDYKTYRDSVVKFIGDIAVNDDDKIGYYSADVVYLNGSTSLITTKAKSGKDTFGEKDTIIASERYTYTNYIPTDADDRTGDQDSTLVETLMIPHELATNDDDEVISWSSKTYNKKTVDLLFKSQIFTTKVPFLSSQDPKSGTLVVEEKYRTDGDLDVAHYYRMDDFDETKHTASWREVNTLANGDSTYEIGSQISENIGTYSRMSDKETKNSGWYNTLTNEFKDTTVYLNAKGTDVAKDISYGIYKDEDGTGDYTSKQFFANGDSTMSRTVKVKEGPDQYKITSTDDGVTSVYMMHKDTTIFEQTDSTTKTTYSAISNDDGSYTILQKTVALSSVKVLATGEMTFFADGSGEGKITEFVDGKAQTPVVIKFDPDGTTYVDGKKVPTEEELLAATK